ncbi:hypothetical protein SAMN02745146_3209 [Hymenobacter daecheongensis DSM 21074]|uniref:DUF4136 domain-containing protein n=1 Tax=Hymenobacter daecheongensis DSM 21074 TaxID=1121955 RepID=A0A1M6JNQ1_9BACT|nr:hypothetical protein [Hymenobacter daecheongensis]SHJ48379.1 hypothetical protein SAMN02745146_3209 [Hymenobacter daecheongensis DSM 21074]
MKTLRLAFLPLLAGCLTLAGPARAQRTSYVQQFAGSTVLLASGDTLQGPLALHHSEDVVLITLPDNTVSTLSAVAVQSFAVKGEKEQRRNSYDDFYDARQGYYYGNPYYNGLMPRQRRERVDTSLVRVYRTYRWNHDNDYSDFKSPAFFEQLSRGPQVLLRREILVERPLNYAPGPYGYGGGLGGVPRYAGSYTEIQDKFYLGTPKGTVVPLRNPKKDLLALFRPQARQLEQYAKENKLSFTEPRDLAFIVNYANYLQAQK